jgi:hypothetical protein
LIILNLNPTAARVGRYLTLCTQEFAGFAHTNQKVARDAEATGVAIIAVIIPRLDNRPGSTLEMPGHKYSCEHSGKGAAARL